MVGLVVILGAMDSEVNTLREAFGEHKDIAYIGTTGVGKVNAAATTQEVIGQYQPSHIILTGVSGALDPELEIGDIGLVIQAIDAEMDARAWNPKLLRGEVPFTGQRIYRSDPALLQKTMKATAKGSPYFPAFVATGSAFLDYNGKLALAREGDKLADPREPNFVPNLYDMETSAVFQVCANNGVPVVGLRVVSDTFMGDAAADFNKFVLEGVQAYTPIVRALLKY